MDIWTYQDLLEPPNKEAKLAVLGHPIAHSLSPLMHNAALDALGYTARYVAIDVAPEDLKKTIKAMQGAGFLGCNCTIPHKQAALALCDELSEQAEALGSVNTLKFNPNGTIYGTNTDALGFERDLKKQFHCSIAELSIAIIGAGGGAGSALGTHCALQGASPLCLINRTQAKLHMLSTRLQLLDSKSQIHCMAPNDPGLPGLLEGIDLLINATSLGLHAGDGLPLSPEAMLRIPLFYDIIYAKQPTPFLQFAKKQGAKFSDGLGMLLHQGALALETWFDGQEPPIAVMEKALKEGIGR